MYINCSGRKNGMQLLLDGYIPFFITEKRMIWRLRGCHYPNNGQITFSFAVVSISSVPFLPQNKSSELFRYIFSRTCSWYSGFVM